MSEFDWRNLDVALAKALKRMPGFHIKESARCWYRGLEEVDIDKNGDAFCTAEVCAMGVFPIFVTHAPTGLVRECADLAAAVDLIAGWADNPPTPREVAEFRRQVAASI